MHLEKNIKVFVVVFLILMLSSGVLAEKSSDDGFFQKFKDKIKKNWNLWKNEGTFDYLKSLGNSFWESGILGNKEMAKEHGIFFIKIRSDKDMGGWFYHYIVGLFAWVFLYGTYRIKKFFKDLKKVARGKDNQLKKGYKDLMKKIEWSETIAGSWWKIFVGPILYVVLLQIPILNRIIQIITLEAFFEVGFFWMVTILVIEVGYFPQFIEWLSMTRMKMKYERENENIYKINAEAIRKR